MMAFFHHRRDPSNRAGSARLLFFSLSAIFLLVACGPATGESDDDDWNDVLNADALASPTTPAANTGESDGLLDVDDGRATVAESESPSDAGLDVAAGTQEVDEQGIIVGFTSDGYAFRGDPQAPIVMETFSDYQCPFCRRFVVETLPFIEEDQIAGGEVVLVFYDFPLPSHAQAPAAHEAAHCAGEEGATAYWAMHDALFDNLSDWAENSEPAELFTGYARDIGLDAEQFQSCLESDEYTSLVEQGANLGVRRGVNSTPSFFINGQALTGAQPLVTFQQAIETVQNGGQLAGAQEPQEAPPSGVAPTPVALDDDVAAAMGDPDAPVTIVEFTDYQCPYCARHAEQTLPQLIEQYVDSGKVYYVVKDLPLDGLHPLARDAAVAARCAAEQDAYWEMHDQLFEGQPQWANEGAASRQVFIDFADDLGLDTPAFSACLTSGRHDDAVAANLDEGRSLGVSATPTFFINGYPVPGAQPLQIFDFAIGLAAEGRLGEAYVQQPEPDPNEPADIPLGDAPRIGEPDAPVVIIEYTDFQCPYCSRHFQQTYPQIVENYVETGQVLYVFKDFPLTSIHPQAIVAAEAARCARDQGAYLPMHDMLFARQNEWNGRGDAAEIFTTYASELNLDTGVFGECLADDRHEGAVRADLEEGTQLGIRGTPAFFINGRFLSGAQPYQVFEQAITQMAAEASEQ